MRSPEVQVALLLLLCGSSILGRGTTRHVFVVGLFYPVLPARPSKSTCSSILLQTTNTDHIEENQKTIQKNKQQQKVKVQIRCFLPPSILSTTPQEARRAWLEFVWEKGGGLPLLGVLTETSRTATKDLETTVLRRRLLPIFMVEELITEEEEEETMLGDSESSTGSTSPHRSCQVKYQVKNGGLLSTEIVPNSHLGVVTFEQTSTDDGIVIELIWDVTFDTTAASRTFLWQAVTERTVTDTCRNFQATIAIPKLYRRVTRLPITKKYYAQNKRNNDNDNDNDDDDKNSSILLLQQVMDDWIQFCWREGAGFPLPIPPIQAPSITSKHNNNSQERTTRYIVPPFLKETLVSAKILDSPETTNDNNPSSSHAAEIQYQVDNPSLFTYQVHSHRGRVRFFLEEDHANDKDTTTTNTTDRKEKKETVVTMKWEIEIRPYHGWSTAVETFTGAVVSCYARNFKCHVQEGKDAMVAFKPPRGGTCTSSTDDLLSWQVRKDSWIGGVLDAHLKDQRGTAEQTIAIFQPWTWGRTNQYDDVGEGEEWRERYLLSADE
jgi:hypothetical protein